MNGSVPGSVLKGLWLTSGAIAGVGLVMMSAGVPLLLSGIVVTLYLSARGRIQDGVALSILGFGAGMVAAALLLIRGDAFQDFRLTVVAAGVAVATVGGGVFLSRRLRDRSALGSDTKSS